MVKRNDVYLAAAALAAAFLLWMIPRVFFSGQGQQVTVTRDGKPIGIYPLTEDTELTFTDGNGGKNRLVIRGGEAYMEDADCPDRLCVGQKAISRKGECIICLPHRLTVEVTAGEEAGVDAVAG